MNQCKHPNSPAGIHTCPPNNFGSAEVCVFQQGSVLETSYIFVAVRYTPLIMHGHANEERLGERLGELHYFTSQMVLESMGRTHLICHAAYIERERGRDWERQRERSGGGRGEGCKCRHKGRTLIVFQSAPFLRIRLEENSKTTNNKKKDEKKHNKKC